MASKRHRALHRHQPDAPQAQVVQNAVKDGNLVQNRRREPKPAFPVYNPGDVDQIFREEWAFGNLSEKGVFAGRKNKDDLIGFASAGGLTGRERIVFYGCVDSEPGTASNDGSSMPELGFAIRRVGVCTGTNTGTRKIYAGDTVVWDFPEYFLDPQSGNPMPLHTTPYNKTRWVFATKSIRHVNAMACLLNFITAVVEKGFNEPRRRDAEAMAASIANGEPAPDVGRDWPVVAKVLREAYEANKLFTHVAFGADPLERIVLFFEQKYPDITTYTLMQSYTFATPNDLRNEMWTGLVRVIAGNAPASAMLDRVTNRPKQSTIDPESPFPFASIAFGLPYLTQELTNLVHSRIMGTALGDSPPGTQLDLNLR